MVNTLNKNIFGIIFLVFVIGCTSGQGWHRIDGGSFTQNWLEGNKAQCDARAEQFIKGFGATANPQTVANLSGPLVAQYRMCMEQKGWTDD